MAKKTPSRPTEPPQRPMLTAPREVAREKLQTQIDKGKELRARQIDSASDLEEAKNEFNRWEEYNYTLLRSLFTTDELAIRTRMGILGGAVVHQPLFKQLEEFHEDIDYHVNKLISYKDQLDLYQEDPAITRSLTVSEQRNIQTSNRVFVVHGHDDLVKVETARFLEKLELKPIILHEQPNQGRTIIEKFEHFSDVGFAVVLLTPDDVGGTSVDHPSKGDSALKGRARQNVILELGFFYGKLGRGKVCALYKPGTDIPSDISGVIYLEIDPSGAWKFQLAKEIEASGVQIDLRKAF